VIPGAWFVPWDWKEEIANEVTSLQSICADLPPGAVSANVTNGAASSAQS